MKETPTFEKAIEEAQAETPDIVKMLILLNQSLAEGDPRAAYTLGSWYLQGQNVDKDVEKAIPLLNQAAEEGVLEALFDLAVCYEQGVGVEENPRLAFEHYLRAALGEIPKPCTKLDVVIFMEWVSPKIKRSPKSGSNIPMVMARWKRLQKKISNLVPSFRVNSPSRYEKLR